MLSVMAVGQGTTCAADNGTPAQGAPVACVTGGGVQVTTSAPAPAAAPTPQETLPLTPEQRPAAPPSVTYQNGKLTVFAKNSRLSDILRAIAEKTGASIDVPEGANERVVSQLGPAPARDVMSALLNGSHFNYVMVGTETDPDAVARVVLTAKSERTDGGPAGSGSAATATATARPAFQPHTALQAAIVQPYQEMLQQAAQQAATPEIQPIAAAESTPEPSVQPVANEGTAANSATATAGAAEPPAAEAPASPEAQKNANNGADKTPQQVLQDLYEARRQMMVQQHQPPPPPPTQQ